MSWFTATFDWLLGIENQEHEHSKKQEHEHSLRLGLLEWSNLVHTYHLTRFFYDEETWREGEYTLTLERYKNGDTTEEQIVIQTDARPGTLTIKNVSVANIIEGEKPLQGDRGMMLRSGWYQREFLQKDWSFWNRSHIGRELPLLEEWYSSGRQKTYYCSLGVPNYFSEQEWYDREGDEEDTIKTEHMIYGQDRHNFVVYYNVNAPAGGHKGDRVAWASHSRIHADIAVEVPEHHHVEEFFSHPNSPDGHLELARISFSHKDEPWRDYRLKARLITDADPDEPLPQITPSEFFRYTKINEL